MSSSFSFSRLGKLITKQFFENSKFYGYAVLALFGLLALVFGFWVSGAAPDYHEEQTWLIFIFGLFIAGSVFASMAFNMLDSKDKGIYWLGLPATHLEKLVCTILYTTVAFTLAYCLCFFLTKSIAVFFIKEFIKEKPGFTYEEMTDYSHGFGQALPYFIYAYFAVQALYLLGAVYFSRYTFVITTVVGAALIFVFIYYIHKIEDGMFDKINWNIISARETDIGVKGQYHLYSVSPALTTAFKYLVQFAWAPLFWVVAWFRLKEKEI